MASFDLPPRAHDLHKTPSPGHPQEPSTTSSDNTDQHSDGHTDLHSEGNSWQESMGVNDNDSAAFTLNEDAAAAGPDIPDEAASDVDSDCVEISPQRATNK